MSSSPLFWEVEPVLTSETKKAWNVSARFLLEFYCKVMFVLAVTFIKSQYVHSCQINLLVHRYF